MSSFWKTQRDIETRALWDTAGRIAGERLEQRRMERARVAIEERTHLARLEALEIAKFTGRMPEIFQETVPEDDFIAEKALMYVLLGELAKVDPNNPLVVYEEAREILREGALIKFCRTGRSKDQFDWHDVVPTCSETERVKDQFR